MFMNYSWPGNVRELENFVERSIALEKSSTVTVKSLPKELVYNVIEKTSVPESVDALLSGKDFNFTEYIDGISKNIILKALELNSDNIKKTAEMLKLSYRSLRYLISKFK
jgi:two-component system response regulator PilR (NtrC family)